MDLCPFFEQLSLAIRISILYILLKSYARFSCCCYCSCLCRTWYGLLSNIDFLQSL